MTSKAWHSVGATEDRKKRQESGNMLELEERKSDIWLDVGWERIKGSFWISSWKTRKRWDNISHNRNWPSCTPSKFSILQAKYCYFLNHSSSNVVSRPSTTSPFLKSSAQNLWWCHFLYKTVSSLMWFLFPSQSLAWQSAPLLSQRSLLNVLTHYKDPTGQT